MGAMIKKMIKSERVSNKLLHRQAHNFLNY